MSSTAYDIKPGNHLGVIKQDICNTAALPLQEARALPAEAYTDQEYFVWEKEHILKKQWLSVAHVSQIPNPGDYINLDMLGERISIVRNQDNAIRVLSRVCVHRGMDIMPPEYGHAASGNCNSFKCPYHHWVYGLDGNLKGTVYERAQGSHQQRIETARIQERNLGRVRVCQSEWYRSAAGTAVWRLGKISWSLEHG